MNAVCDQQSNGLDKAHLFHRTERLCFDFNRLRDNPLNRRRFQPRCATANRSGRDQMGNKEVRQVDLVLTHYENFPAPSPLCSEVYGTESVCVRDASGPQPTLKTDSTAFGATGKSYARRGRNRFMANRNRAQNRLALRSITDLKRFNLVDILRQSSGSEVFKNYASRTGNTH